MAAPTFTYTSIGENFATQVSATVVWGGGDLLGAFVSWDPSGPAGMQVNPAGVNLAFTGLGASAVQLPGGAQQYVRYFYITAATLTTAGLTPGNITVRGNHAGANGIIVRCYEVNGHVGAPVYYEETLTAGTSISETIPAPDDSLAIQLMYAHGNSPAGTADDSQTTQANVNYSPGAGGDSRQINASRAFTTAGATEDLGWTLSASTNAILLTAVFSAARTVSTLSPADNATNVPVDDPLVITFNLDVSRGTGNLVITETGVGVFESIDVQDTGQVSISGAVVTITPSGDFDPSTAYDVTFPVGWVPGSAGISSATTWNFTTAASSGTTENATGAAAAIATAAGQGTLEASIAATGAAAGVAAASGQAVPSVTVTATGSAAGVGVQAGTIALSATATAAGSAAALAGASGTAVPAGAVVGTGSAASVAAVVGSTTLAGAIAAAGSAATLAGVAGLGVPAGTVGASGSAAALSVDSGTVTPQTGVTVDATGAAAGVAVASEGVSLAATSAPTGSSASIAALAGTAVPEAVVAGTGAAASVSLDSGTATPETGITVTATGAGITVGVDAGSVVPASIVLTAGSGVTLAVAAGQAIDPTAPIIDPIPHLTATWTPGMALSATHTAGLRLTATWSSTQ